MSVVCKKFSCAHGSSRKGAGLGEGASGWTHEAPFRIARKTTNRNMMGNVAQRGSLSMQKNAAGMDVATQAPAPGSTCARAEQQPGERLVNSTSLLRRRPLQRVQEGDRCVEGAGRRVGASDTKAVQSAVT